MSTITPTPGRMIWFQPSPELGLGNPNPAAPLAAVVASVNEDGTINICAFDRQGNPVPQQNVPICDPADGSTFQEDPELGHWAYWMPYQIAAAASAVSVGTTSDSESSLDGVGAGGAKDPT